jgi:hypothetical protein
MLAFQNAAALAAMIFVSKVHGSGHAGLLFAN